MTEGKYAGDVLPRQAWEMLAADRRAVLVDCRTAAEWAYVGVADLTQLDKSPLYVEWLTFPDMRRNADFLGQLVPQLAGPDVPVVFLCRSGQRSKGAAVALTAAGFAHSYNIAGGFEGDKDAHHHRGAVNGWKIDGLPWMQG